MTFFLAISVSLVLVISSPSPFFSFLHGRFLCCPASFSFLRQFFPLIPVALCTVLETSLCLSLSACSLSSPLPMPPVPGPASASTKRNFPVCFVHKPSLHSHLLGLCDFVCAKESPRTQGWNGLFFLSFSLTPKGAPKGLLWVFLLNCSPVTMSLAS